MRLIVNASLFGVGMADPITFLSVGALWLAAGFRPGGRRE
jgi:hypothetical protein